MSEETTTTEEPKSAAAEHAETTKTTKATETAETTQTAETTTPTESPKSAAAAHAEGSDDDKPQDVDLTSISDDDWAKAVMPDPADENAPKPDRTIIGQMAKELREGGVQPHLMQKIVKSYESKVDAIVKKRQEDRAARMTELNQRCEKEVTKEEWQNFGAVYNEHISKDAELKAIFDHTELGSNPTLIKIISLAGATIRVDQPPPAAATTGSGQEDLDRRLFERTVPAHLR